MAKTLAAYLADLSRDELEHMQRDIRAARSRLEEEIRSIEFEEGLVAQALTRKARRSGGGGASPTGSARVTQDRVLDLISEDFRDRAFNSGDVSRAFASRGTTIAPTAVRHHLRALLKADKLQRYGAKEFLLRPATASQNGTRTAELPGPAANGSSTAVLQTSPHTQSLSAGGGRPREPEEDMAAPS